MYRNILKVNILLVQKKLALNFCFKDYAMGLLIIIIMIIIIIIVIITIIIKLFFYFIV